MSIRQQEAAWQEKSADANPSRIGNLPHLTTEDLVMMVHSVLSYAGQVANQEVPVTGRLNDATDTWIRELVRKFATLGDRDSLLEVWHLARACRTYCLLSPSEARRVEIGDVSFSADAEVGEDGMYAAGNLIRTAEAYLALPAGDDESEGCHHQVLMLGAALRAFRGWMRPTLDLLPPLREHVQERNTREKRGTVGTVRLRLFC